MNYEEQIKRWAAKRLDRSPSEIDRVEFQMEEGYWLSDITYADGYERAVVWYRKRSQNEPTDYDYISVDRDDFGALIREIMEA